MDEKLKSLYDSYVQNGILSSQTTFEQFSQADDNIIQSLYQQGIEKKVISPKTDIETFSSAFFLPKKETEDLGSTTEEVTTTVASEEAPMPQPSASLDSGEPLPEGFEFPTTVTPGIIQDPSLRKAKYLEPIKDEGEKPTLIEREFGKNEFTDFFGDLYRAYEQGSAQPVEESLDLYMKGKGYTDKDIQNYVEAVKDSQMIGESDEMKEFQKIYKEEGEGFFGVLKGLYKNPSIAPQILVSSVSSMIKPSVLKAGGAGAVAAAPVGLAGGPLSGVTVPGAMISGGIMASTATLETALTFNELLQEELGEKEFTEKNVKDILNDPEKLKKIRLKSAARGAVIGIVDGITGGVTGKVVKKVASKTGKKLLGTTAGLGVESVGGSLGETAGKAVAGQEMDVADIALEGIAGSTTAPITIGKGLLDIKKPKYEVNGQKVDKEFMVAMIDQLSDEDISKSNAKINIEGDQATNNLLQERLNTYKINQDIPSTIKEESDRKELSSLEVEKANLKKKNTQAARNREEQINNRIKEITDKYDIKEAPVAEVVSEEVAVEEKGDITVSGTFDGFRFEGKEVADLRQEARGNDGKIIETTNESGEKIFTLVKETFDAVGRDGYVGVSITLPKNSKVKSTDVKTQLEVQMNKISKGKNLSGESIRNINELDISKLDKDLKLPTTEQKVVEKEVTVEDKSVVTPETFEIKPKEGEGSKTIEVTNNEDGSRSIVQKVDGKEVSSDNIPKDNTVETERYIEGTFGEITGKPETTPTPSEAISLQDQIRIESKASTDSKADQKNRKKTLAVKVKEVMEGIREDATINKNKTKAIINKVNNTNLNNPIQVEKLVNYVEKTMADADYAAKIKEAESNKTSIKKRAKGKKNANIVESAKNFLKVDPSLVDDIDAYLDQSRKINDGLKPTSVRVKGVDVAPSFNVQEVDTYVDETITTQEGKIKDIINSKFEEVTGADPKDFNFTEIVEMINEGREDVSEKLDPIKKSNIKKAYDTYAGVAKEIITTSKDPFTGEPIELTSDQKKIVKDLTEMDPSEMSKEDAVKAIDALNNFAVNQSLAGAQAVTSKYKGESFSNKEKSKGTKAKPLKFLRSEKLGNFMNNNFTTLPIMLENMFGKEKALQIARGMGLSGVIQGKAKGVSENKKIVNQYSDKFSKSKPNEKSFNDSSNITERGLFGFMRRTSGDEKVEFGRRKKLIEETIDYLRKTGNKEERAKAEDYQNAYDKILKDSENIKDVESKTDAVNKKAVEWWTDKWSNYYDKLSDVNLQVYNEVLDKDMNYIPDVFTLASQETKAKDGTEGSSFFNTSKYTDKSKVGTLKKTTKPSKLPRKGNKVTRYISLDFDTNNARTLEAALKDIYTAESVMQVSGFNDSESLKSIIPNKEDRDLFVGRINNYISRLKNKENIGADDMKFLQKAANTIAGFGATRALGGLTQPVKQTVPVAINTLINAGRLDLGLIYNSDFNNWLDNSGMPISNRGVGSSVEFESINKALEKKSQKILTKGIINPLKNANEKVLEYLLQKPDAAIARSSFGSYYLQSLKEQGIDNKNIDWSTHKPNQKALDYAQQQVDRQQNVSDTDLQGNFLGSRDGFKRLVKQIVFPFASFTMNQKARTYSDIINTFSENSSRQDKAKSLRSLVGLGAETLVFRGIQAAVAGMLYDIATDQLGYEESEEEKEKRKKNVERSAATGVTIDMLSPLPVTDGVVVDLANKTIEYFEDEDIDDKDKFRLYEQDSEMDYGVLGIAADKANELIDFIQLANDGTYTQKSFGKETTKEIGYDEQEVLKDMVPLLGLYNLGLLPNEFATTIRYMTKVAKNKSKKDAAKEKARQKELNKTKISPRTGKAVSSRDMAKRQVSKRPTEKR